MLDKIYELLKPDVSSEVKLTGISLYLAKMLEKHTRRLDLMETKVLML